MHRDESNNSVNSKHGLGSFWITRDAKEKVGFLIAFASNQVPLAAIQCEAVVFTSNCFSITLYVLQDSGTQSCLDASPLTPFEIE